MWSSTDRLIAFLIWIRHQVLVTLVISIMISTVISLSVSVYSAFYYFYIPSHTLISDLNFLFTPCDVDTQNEKGYSKCSFPTAYVDLKQFHDKDEQIETNRNFFQPNQKYTFQLHLNLASSQIEERGRMFVVCLTLLDHNQRQIPSSTEDENVNERCVSSIITPKSVYARFLDFMLSYPIQAMYNVFEQSSINMGLALTTDTNHWTRLTFYREYQDINNGLVASIMIKIKDVQIEPLKATFDIHESNLILWKDPILYLMTNHSNLTCVVTVLTISIPILILILMAWDKLTKPTFIKSANDTNIKKIGEPLISHVDFLNDPSQDDSKVSEKGNMSTRYDHARQRLKATKIKRHSEDQNTTEAIVSASPMVSGQSYNLQPESRTICNVTPQLESSEFFEPANQSKESRNLIIHKSDTISNKGKELVTPLILQGDSIIESVIPNCSQHNIESINASEAHGNSELQSFPEQEDERTTIEKEYLSEDTSMKEGTNLRRRKET